MADQTPAATVTREELETVVIRFAGDSGDGMQLTGTQFTNASAALGNDVSTLPDYPAEIRAPVGTLAGVSGFQLSFSSHDIHTPGDAPNVLVAMNPAALKVNLHDLEEGGLLITNSDAFTAENLTLAGYPSNPLEDGSLAGYRVVSAPITTQTIAALAELGLPKKEAERSKNLYTLGIVFFLFDRPLENTLHWIEDKFGKNPAVKEANARALRAGYYFAETMELFSVHRYRVRKAALPPGTYRKITGNEATALGLVTAAHCAGAPLFYGSYPITPASEILHELSALKNYGVKTFQAEDEIAAICAVIGAAYAGHIAVTGTSGPGLALKTEAMGLGVMAELPIVIVDVQRGGPSTGLPTKTEQADLFQAVLGRNGECPLVVVAPRSPADCFFMAIEAVRLATRYMVPVIMLSDGYLGNGAEPWRLPKMNELPDLRVRFARPVEGEKFAPYRRNDRLARPWALPGTAGLEHRLGGLEKADVTGGVSYDPDNHHRMITLRAQKVAGIAHDIPPLDVFGPDEGDLLIVGWGGTGGTLRTSAERLQAEGHSVAHAHLRYLNPFPANTGEVLKRYRKILVPEINLGQLRLLLQAHFMIPLAGLNIVRGLPLKVRDVVHTAHELLARA